MLLQGLFVVVMAVACTAHPHQQQNYFPGPEAAPHPPTSQHGHQPIPLGPQSLNEQRPQADSSDLKTDASTWWKSWNRWEHSYGYNNPGHANPIYNNPGPANPVYYTTKTHYVYTPKTYTYYAPETYTTTWTENQPRYSNQHSNYENQW